MELIWSNANFSAFDFVLIRKLINILAKAKTSLIYTNIAFEKIQLTIETFLLLQYLLLNIRMSFFVFSE